MACSRRIRSVSSALLELWLGVGDIVYALVGAIVLTKVYGYLHEKLLFRAIRLSSLSLDVRTDGICRSGCSSVLVLQRQSIGDKTSCAHFRRLAHHAKTVALQNASPPAWWLCCMRQAVRLNCSRCHILQFILGLSTAFTIS